MTYALFSYMKGVNSYECQTIVVGDPGIANSIGMLFVLQVLQSKYYISFIIYYLSLKLYSKPMNF